MEQQDWDKLNSLRLELNQNLMAYDQHAQEKFTKLLVESLLGKGDLPVSRTK